MINIEICLCKLSDDWKTKWGIDLKKKLKNRTNDKMWVNNEGINN